MKLEDIANLSRLVADFGARHDLHFKALPVIVWEFATMSEFFHAKGELAAAVMADAYFSTQPPSMWDRVVGPDTCEIDFYGVTFRLVCRQLMDTPAGVKGVTQVQVVHMPKLPNPWSKPG